MEIDRQLHYPLKVPRCLPGWMRHTRGTRIGLCYHATHSYDHCQTNGTSRQEASSHNGNTRIILGFSYTSFGITVTRPPATARSTQSLSLPRHTPSHSTQKCLKMATPRRPSSSTLLDRNTTFSHVPFHLSGLYVGSGHRPTEHHPLPRPDPRQYQQASQVTH